MVTVNNQIQVVTEKDKSGHNSVWGASVTAFYLTPPLWAPEMARFFPAVVRVMDFFPGECLEQYVCPVS